MKKNLCFLSFFNYIFNNFFNAFLQNWISKLSHFASKSAKCFLNMNVESFVDEIRYSDKLMEIWYHWRKITGNKQMVIFFRITRNTMGLRCRRIQKANRIRMEPRCTSRSYHDELSGVDHRIALIPACLNVHPLWHATRAQSR